MVFQILKQQQITQPLYNSGKTGYGLNFDDMQRFISDRIFKQIKQTSALVGILDTVVSDHFQGPVDFFDINGKSLGSTNLKRAKKFWSDNKVKEAMQGAGFDYFVDGSCFAWYDNLNMRLTPEQKRAMTLNSNVTEYGNYLMQVASSQMKIELEMPRKVGYLASSITEIISKDGEILGYKQEAGSKSKFWSNNQVRHIKLINWNGEIRGFSGLKALVRDIAIMYMIKENMLAKLSNGGSADNIIYLKSKNGVNKARFERLRTALESFSHLKKSHGNMPIDAEVGVIPLSTSLKDMEYRELAMFAVSEFCMAIGMPVSRTNYLMTGSGGSSNKGELSGNSEDAYQKKINNRRDTWEQEWNVIFNKAGFSYKFRRNNLQDEVRETQASVQRSAYVQGILSNLAKVDKQLTTDAMLQLLSGTKRNVGVDDIEQFKPSENMMMMQGNGNDDMPNKNDMKSRNSELKGRVSNDRMASKMRTASNNGMSA